MISTRTQVAILTASNCNSNTVKPVRTVLAVDVDEGDRELLRLLVSLSGKYVFDF